MRLSAEYPAMLQNRLAILANNIANSSTPGFKEGLLSLEESYDAQEKSNTVALYGGVVSGGSRPVIYPNLYNGKRLNFDQGSLAETGNPLDLAISGEGFFQVKTAEGRLGYTRAGLFSLDGSGNLVNNEGMLVEPKINIPENVSGVTIADDGTVFGTAGKVVLGQIKLFRFSNPDGLEQSADNLFFPTAASGQALAAKTGSGGTAEIKSGMLEQSNTDLASAMTNIIQAQRAYQIDLRVTSTQNDMMMQAIAMRG